MSLRNFLEQAAQSGDLIEIDRPVSVNYELANVAHALEGKPVLFNKIIDYADWRVCAGPCSDRKYFSMDLGVPVAALIPHLAQATENPQTPPMVAQGACQEVVLEQFNLHDLPILFHLPGDGGHYVASNVVITEDPELGRNMCYHRLLRLDERRFAARIIERRGTWTAMQKVEGDLPVAICIGVSQAVHLAAAMSAAPDVDELAVAQRQGTLYRNFQGYSTHSDCDLVAMGVTSIGMVSNSYSQNVRGLEEYYRRIDQGRLPIFRGIALSTDDLIRRDVITRLICNFTLPFAEVEQSWGIDFSDYFAADLATLDEMEADGLLVRDEREVRVLPRGRLLIRNICMAFDRYLPPVEQQKGFSRVI